MRYILNPKTLTLHFETCCYASNGTPDTTFNTEEAAIEKYGPRVRMCKKCLQKREEIIKDYK